MTLLNRIARWAATHPWYERLAAINLLVALFAYEAGHFPDEVQHFQQQVIAVLAHPPGVPEKSPPQR